MNTLKIKITNAKAYKLLKDLEDLNLIKILKNNPSKTISLSEKYAGKLSAAVAKDIQKYVSNSREEWEERNI